ncbi:hypothetical protein INR49_012227 [Caranx melampygus]|nr:hypothetical protein INR49_012227 [Caranx melampygus]
MSTRALRRLRGKQRGQEALDIGNLTLDDSPEEQAGSEEEQLDVANVSPVRKDNSRKAKKTKAQKNYSNIFELIGDVDNEAEKISPDEDAEKQDGNETSGKERLTTERLINQSSSGDGAKKKKKKKKSKATSVDGHSSLPDDNIDLLLENLEQPNGLSLQNEDCGADDRRSVLHVEHR